MEMTSQLSPREIEEMVKKAANKRLLNFIVRMCYMNSKAKLSACNWLNVRMGTSGNYIKYYKIQYNITIWKFFPETI